VLFDTVINGQPRKGLAEAGRTGWVYILDRTNGKPLIGIEERPVPQEPRQKTAKTQPYPIGDAIVPQCAQPMEGYEKAGCIFEAFWDEPVLIQPSGQGGTNWSPMPYSPDRVFFIGSGNNQDEYILASSQPIRYRAALHEWHSGAANRLAIERHLHRDRESYQ